MKNASKILALLGGASVLAVIAGLPVDANGFFLTEDQMNALDASIDATELQAAALATANEEVTRLTAEIATANETLSTVNGQLATSNSELATAQTKITELEAMEGSVSGTVKDADTFSSEEVVDPMAFDFQQDILNRLNA